MMTANHARSTTLSVSNFGPIAEAEVDLRPLSVFIGPSNTGKSYMAVLIYALHRFFATYASNLSGSGRFFSSGAGIGFSSSARSQRFLSAQDVENLLAWASDMNLDQPTRIREPLPSPDLPESIAKLIRPALRGINQYSEALDEEVARCFGIEESASLIRYPGGGEAQVSLSLNSLAGSDAGRYFRYDIGLSTHGIKFGAHIPEDMSLSVHPSTRGISITSPQWRAQRARDSDPNGDRRAGEIIGRLSGAVMSNIVSPMAVDSYYLPADRAGVMHAHRVVVRSLIARASRAALRPELPLPALSGVLGDFLEQLIDLADYFDDLGEIGNDYSTRLENTILRGSVLLERGETGYPSFVYRPGDWDRDLPLKNASSMVSEMAPVVLYLRYLVDPGDLLIIEEPESHLHPAMQVAFTRELASIVRAGVRVIVTTHSEWVLEELANLVLLSELPEESRPDIPGTDVALAPGDIGAWLFDQDSSSEGSVVREIPLDRDVGTFPARYEVVTEDLYNRFATISNRIEEMKCQQQSWMR